MMVNLGRDAPSWELARWGRDALGFLPLDEGGYALRGDRWNMLYSGEKQSHRFAILDGEHFEYDIILNREPESNRVYLALEGWEGFDFFRQPDNLGPEILRGSYAVYKKEFVVNSPAYHVGTGKICHIHRPEIVDARGRRVWGDVAINKGVMTLTVPEGWLGEAKYPVVVDPVIGSSTVGAYITYPFISQYMVDFYTARDGTNFNMANSASNNRFEIISEVALNRFTAGENLQGNYKAWFYAHNSQYTAEHDFQSWPALYNNTANNKPSVLLSDQEEEFNLRVSGINPEGWKSANLNIPNTINSGTAFWFGVHSYYSFLRFDYGTPCIKYYLNYCYNLEMVVEEDDDGELYEYEAEIDAPRHEWLRREENVPLDQKGRLNKILTTGDYNASNAYPEARLDFKLSMYLGIPAAYVRTLTQGAKLTDSRKTASNFKKTLSQAVRLTGARKLAGNYNRAMPNATAAQDAMSRKGDSKRSMSNAATTEAELKRYAGINKQLETVGSASAGLFRLLTFPRHIAETVRTADGLGLFRELLRRITLQAGSGETTKSAMGFRRNVASTALTATTTATRQVFLRTLLNTIKAGDWSGYSAIWLRRLPEQGTATDGNRHIGGYIRGLYVAARSVAETGHTAEYCRKQEDTASVAGAALRHLLIFIRLLTTGFVRDFIIRRFLKSNEDIVLKSPVCREIEIESALH
jgi:hypothetical protein